MRERERRKDTRERHRDTATAYVRRLPCTHSGTRHTCMAGRKGKGRQAGRWGRGRGGGVVCVCVVCVCVWCGVVGKVKGGGGKEEEG